LCRHPGEEKVIFRLAQGRFGHKQL